MHLPSIDDWTFFDRVARAESLTQVAREWGVSLPAVSKRLRKLEEQRGVQLVRRSTRTLTLTEEGARFAIGAARVVREIAEAEDSLTASAGIRGTIAIHSTLGLGRAHIAPAVQSLARAHPQLRVELEMSTQPLNVSGTPFDIGIRVGMLTDSRLRTRLLYRQRRILCAAPDYLLRAGTPTHPHELIDHECIVIRENESDFALWRFGEHRDEMTVRVGGRMLTNDGDAATAWAVAGAGIIMRSEWHVRPLIAAGELVQVMPEVPTPEANITAVYDVNAAQTMRVSTALDHLADSVRARLDPVFQHASETN